MTKFNIDQKEETGKEERQGGWNSEGARAWMTWVGRVDSTGSRTVKWSIEAGGQKQPFWGQRSVPKVHFC